MQMHNSVILHSCFLQMTLLPESILKYHFNSFRKISIEKLSTGIDTVEQVN